MPKMKNTKKSNEISLGRGSRITIAIFSFLFALMMLPMAVNEKTILHATPSLFCVLIVGACVLPLKIRGYCGDIIAITVIGLAVWFFWVWYKNPQPGDNPFRFAALFGGLAVAYLVKRYRPKKDIPDA